ncbi:MAG: flap endonuclease-1 [Candidatus Aenigmatarchaeota archaeon]
MGVDISSLVEPREIELLEMSGRRIALDAFNIMYQFLTIVRDRMTGEPLRDSHGRITSHLSGLLYRTSNLVESGIKPVFVFDGKPPALKRATVQARMEQKEEAKNKWEAAVAAGEEAIKYAQAAAELKPDMVEQAKTLLDYIGVPWIQAPSEGEIQCAFMCRRGDVWASGSQDYDSLLAGSPMLVRNLSITGRRKVPNKEVYVQVRPELIELEAMLGRLGITQDQLVVIGILVGTDYSEGVKGVGPKAALKLVREHRTLAEVLGHVEWTSPVPAQEVYEFIKNPPVTEEYELEWREPDAEKLREFMHVEHDFSAERVDKVIERLQAAWTKGRQSSLSGWLKK